MCIKCHELKHSSDEQCPCYGIRRSVDIVPFMNYMKKRIKIRDGLNVEDAILTRYRFTNVKRNWDPGSVYVVAELCCFELEVCITILMTFVYMFIKVSVFLSEIKKWRYQ